MGKEIIIPWRPQPRQLTALRAAGVSHPFDGGQAGAPVARVVGYGGAAGGGKTDTLLIIGIVAGLTFPGCKIGYFRRTYTQLEGPGGAIMRSQELMAGWAKWNGQLHQWTLPNGSILKFCYCQSLNDVYNYQSQQFDVLLFDEATQFAKFQVRYLLTRNRLTVPMPAPVCAMATNPGNIGHQWFKAEFVEIGAPEQPARVEVEEGKFETHIFIPAKLADNQILERRDPLYRQTLENQDEETRRMLLEGDWDVFKGQVFSEFRRELHVEEPWHLPDGTRFFTSGDRGMTAASALYRWAILPDGDLRVIGEVYETGLITSALGARWQALGHGEYAVADPAMWGKDGQTGEKEAEVLVRDFNIPLLKADNDRINGLHRVHEWLKTVPGRDGAPSSRLKIWTTCPNLIRELPQLVYDKTRFEDVDDDSGIHHADAYSAFRYGLMSRPAPADLPKKKEPVTDVAERERLWLERMNEKELGSERKRGYW